MEKVGKKRRGLKIALIALAVLLVLAAGGLAFAGNYLFRFALDPQGGGMLSAHDLDNLELEGEYAWFAGHSEDRWLTSHDGLELHALYLPREDSHQYAVVCHGYGSIPQYGGKFAAKFYEMGYSVLAPAARAHERSGGRYAGMGWPERRDIVDWVDAIVEQDPQAEVVLFGISMGGATVMMTAGEDLPENVKGIVEDCGYTTVWDIFEDELAVLYHLPSFPILTVTEQVARLRAGYGFREASALEQVKKAQVPILFIHGSEDNFVHTEMVYPLYEACPTAKELLVVEGAGHGQAYSMDPALYMDTVFTFLDGNCLPS